MARIFETFTDRDAALWGRRTVMLRHRLAEHELFREENLARLIETLPARSMQITHMAAKEHDLSSWQHGERGDLSGAEMIEAVKRGRIWINMMAIDRADPRFAELLGQMYDELREFMPGFRTSRRKLGLLFSSPNAQVFYHADVPGQALWQIRGSKRIRLYPAAPPFLQHKDLENVVRRITEEEIPFEPWFDDHAETIDLEPGQMLHWPLNAPHRVVNHDCLNVSLTTEHWTPEIRRSYAMNFGNGLLRSAGIRPRSRSTDGPAFWAKVAMVAAWRYSGLQDRQRHRIKTGFRVDPKASGGVAPITADRA